MNARTTTSLLVAGAVAGWLGVAALADIEGSSHDFSSSNWAGGEICKPCHTPHFGNTDIGFLWAHEMSTQPYTLYDGSQSSPGGVNELDQFSRMCLSCHDGTVALNNFHNGAGPPRFISPAARIGGDGNLQDDHPIGNTAIYPITGSEGLNAPSPTESGFYGFGGSFFPEIPLFPYQQTDQVVSCSSCHTPHAVAGVDHLLRKSNNGSQLCLTCHIK